MNDDNPTHASVVDQAFDSLRSALVPGGPSPEVVSAVLEAGSGLPDEPRPSPLQNSRVKRRRLAKLAAAGALLLAVGMGLCYFVVDRAASLALAHVSRQIEKAKTVTWKETFYMRVFSKDGKRCWIKTETHQRAYQEPGLYRNARVEKDGSINRVEIDDRVRGRHLELDHDDKTARLKIFPPAQGRVPGPFDGWIERLKGKSDAVEWFATKEIAGRKANGFRISGDEAGESYDLWVDAKTRRLLSIHVPGADVCDPDRDPARHNPPETEWSKGFSMAFVQYEIVFDRQLDDSLFSLEPPKGYTLSTWRRADVTEKEMIDYLGLVAQYYDNTFPDRVLPFPVRGDDPIEMDKIDDKPEGQRTPAEQKLWETRDRYMRLRLGMMPTGHFVKEHTVDGTWRYLGKGVKLGQKDRVVCWYQPKGSKTYRAVYGDLSVKDVAPEDLPLPVKP